MKDISTQMRTAVAIPTLGRDSLYGLLKAIDRMATRLQFSLFVYANGASAFERTSEIISRFPSLLIELRNTEDGFASSRNSALRELRSLFDLIIFLDDDIVPSDDSIELLMSAAKESGDRVMLSGFSRRIPEVPNKLHALHYPKARQAPGGSQSCLPAYMLAVKTKELVPQAAFPSTLDRTGGEDTALTWWLHSTGWHLSYVDGALCTEMDARSRLNPSALLFRRVASSAVLRLCYRSQLAPWQWTGGKSSVIASNLMTVVQICCCWLAGVSPPLAYHTARVLGAILGSVQLVPTLDKGGYWRITRLRTRNG
jgi:Glycosyl transferase family 2